MGDKNPPKPPPKKGPGAAGNFQKATLDAAKKQQGKGGKR